ncbi:mechanosensitive ion channel [Candidatus Peribacteria bacterium]|nr:mechanosensitive ion channel [Candidatus Peribacteria bacterium]
MLSLRTSSLGLLSCILLSLDGVALAQQSSSFSYDERTLTMLYEASLKKNEADSYIEKRIADERTKIRILADEEVKTLVEPSERDPQTTDTAAPTKAVDRQRAVVQLLEDHLRDRKADLELLNEEEQKYYKDASPQIDTDDNLRLTKTHPELLAKKAVLEERIDALDAGLVLQKDRLSKLNRTQWLEQFTTLIGFFSYVLIILGAVFLDRVLRRRVARRFEEKGKRYIVAKFVSAGIYSIAVLWILSKILSDHPDAIASLAIVGAGIAIALQDVVKDFMGWIIILQRRLYKLGNRVSIGQYTGDVVDIGPLRTTMLEISVGGSFNAHERTGKILYLPNSLVLRESVLNYNTTSDFMSVEVQVTITYASNWRKAEQILKDVLMKQTKDFSELARIQQRRRTALFYTMWEVGEPEIHVDLASSGVLFTLKFIVPIGKRRSVVTSLSREILEQFNADREVELAYNTIQIVGGKEVS